MLEFVGFRCGGGNDKLTLEQRYKAVTSVALYLGQALKLSAGRLCACTGVADSIYAVSDVSVAAADVSAGFIPKVYPVNSKQIWKSSCTTAMSAAMCVYGTGCILSTTIATAFVGDKLGTNVFVYDFTTGDTPVSGGAPSSAIYGIFQCTLITSYSA